MKNENKDFKNQSLKLKVKEMIKKSKEMNLIKNHTEAFDTIPTELEQHKGKLLAYRK